MKFTFTKRLIGGSIGAILICLSITPGVYAHQSGIPGPLGGELRGITQFTARIVCARCDLTEARRAQPNLNNLYQINSKQDPVVIQVESFTDSAEHRRWESIVGLSHQLYAHAPDAVLQELSAEENLFRRIVVTGLLRSSRTLDIDNVKIEG